MSRYKAYGEYKDSGVEWLGDVPAHWTVSKVKYLTEFQVGWTPPTKDDANFEGDNLWANISDLRGREIFDTNKKISDHAAKAASMEISPQGSLLYSFKLSVGAVSFAGKDMYTNEAIATFLPISKLPLAYLYYVLPKYLIENASTNIYGARILNKELISNADLLAPPFSEAEKIANFLDHETAKIDLLIEKQQALIELLKEKRQAVISHAVTKGLNPNAPMKGSGVEWLGEVPEHWRVSKLGWLCEFISYGFTNPMPSTDDGPYMLTAADIEFGRIKYEEARKTSEEDFKNLLSAKSKPLKGDVLITKDGTLGRVTVFDELHPTCISQSIALLRLLPNVIDPEFLSLALMGGDYQSRMTFDAGGTTIKHIYISVLAKMNIVLPEIDEQKNIVVGLNSKLAKVDKLINSAQVTSNLLQERRTALISAAVTGKIDVRDWQKPALA